MRLNFQISVFNEGVNATNQLTYDAWGANNQLSGDMHSPFGYGGSYGYQTDNDSGLLLVGHRYYDPGIGRFYSVDPIHDGLNWYAYVGNNPVSFNDPTGLLFREGLGLLGGVAAGAAGAETGPLDIVIIAEGSAAGSYVGSLVDDWLDKKFGTHFGNGDPGGNALNDGARALAGGALGKLLGCGLKYIGGLLEDGCFVEGTLVKMADGTFKPIENIKKGDVVASRDQNSDKNGNVVAKKVVKTSVREVHEIVKITFSNGEVIETTINHPFYVEGKSFTRADQLAIGNSIVTRAGPPCKIVNIEVQWGARYVYNLEVEDAHTYFVGKAGFWVHNANCAEIAEDLLAQNNGNGRLLRIQPAEGVFFPEELDPPHGPWDWHTVYQHPNGNIFDPMRGHTQGTPFDIWKNGLPYGGEPFHIFPVPPGTRG